MAVLTLLHNKAYTSLSCVGTNFAVARIKWVAHEKICMPHFSSLSTPAPACMISLVSVMRSGEHRQPKRTIWTIWGKLETKNTFWRAQSTFSFLIAENLILCAHSVGMHSPSELVLAKMPMRPFIEISCWFRTKRMKETNTNVFDTTGTSTNKPKI